jgi:cytochrome P450
MQFKPERWLDPSYATDPNTGSPRFVPFGIGPKACVAQQMAMVQCKVRVVEYRLYMMVGVEHTGVQRIQLG